MRVTNQKINFLSKGQYIRVKNPLHKQSEKAYMCFKTRRASTRDYMVLKQAVVSRSSDSCQTFIRQFSGSFRQSSEKCQAIIRLVLIIILQRYKMFNIIRPRVKSTYLHIGLANIKKSNSEPSLHHPLLALGHSALEPCIIYKIQVVSLFEQGTLVRKCPWCLLLQMFRSTSCYKKAQLTLEQFPINLKILHCNPVQGSTGFCREIPVMKTGSLQ